MTDAYNPATRPCSGGPTKGATVLQQSVLGYWRGTTNLGVYVCRPTADGAPSVHGNGRAGDIGTRGPTGQEIADWLVANHTVLGVQLVIWDHRIWNVSIPGGWRPYGCDKPGSDKDHHTTHVHWEINVDAGTRLTQQIVESVHPNHPGPPPLPGLEYMEVTVMPVVAQWGGAVFLVDYDMDTGKCRRRTFPNTSRLAQVMHSQGVTADRSENPYGNAFPVLNDQFEQVYQDLGPA